MRSVEIRQKYLDFFKSKEHQIIPSASLLPENDSSSLFTSSGMQPLVPYLMGEKHPAGNRLVDSQKCLRSGDIEEVGDNRHNTFFEMLGNWSLGNYFKSEQLSWLLEFLVEQVNLDPKRLYVTVYQGNQEIGIEKDLVSVEIWKDLFFKYDIEAKDVDFAEDNGLQGGRIFYYSDHKNWWSRSGVPSNMPIGEIGGPDSEIFYDLGLELKRHENSEWKDQPCHVNCDCGRFVELGNSVFIQFIKTENGFKELKQKNVDFGGGLERITMAVQDKDNVFETDLFSNVLSKISQLSSDKNYRDYMKEFEVIADHLKSAVFVMGDDKGIPPSNVDQGYIVRRLVRRAIRYGRQLGITTDSWTKEIAQIIIDDYKEIYNELERNSDFIIKNLEEEELKFSKTLERGLKEFEKIINKRELKIDSKDTFNLFQTYGFPFEMTQELALEKGLEIDEKGFNEELKKHQDKSRTASAGKFKGGLADSSEETTKLHTTAHLLLSSLRKVLGDHVFQKGSNITAERLRFDFSHNEKMTDEQKLEVERLVNEVIQKDLKVIVTEMTLEEAKAQNAMGVFESKYDEKVKVYKIGEGDDMFSNEICGGPHVDYISGLGVFKIKKEQSSSAGVRRIKAVLN